MAWSDRQDRLPILLAGMFMVFAVLLLPVSWHSNEENYFMLAYQWVAPTAFSEYSAIFDRSNARFLNMFLTGQAVAWLGYDAAHGVLRVLCAALYALGFAALLRSLGLTLLDGLLVLALFNLLGPDLMGSEWLFEGVEAKTFAYGFVFLAFAAAVSGRWKSVVAAGVLATYLHFLIGGFWMVVAGALYAALHGRWRTAASAMALYGILIAPLLVILVRDQIGPAAPPTGTDGPTADYIYSIIRNPHHVAPFADPNGLYRWARGAVSTAVICVCGYYTAQMAPRPLRVFALMLTGLGIYLLLAMAISWADRHTGSFGKFYLFRPAALTLLLACLASVLLVRTVRQPDMVQIKRILIFGIIGLFLGNVALQFVLKVRSGLSPSGLETIAAVQALTEPRDVVVVEPIGDIDIKFVGLHRLLDRPTLVSWKFVPTNADEIHRWWGLVQWREALFRKGCDGEGIPARYILVLRPETLPVIGSCGTLAWTNGMQALVRVSR